MKVFIDAGHNYSGSDTGATGNGLREQDITYYIADKLKTILSANNLEVILSRNSLNENISNGSVSNSLATRVRLANNGGADLFVSIHCNAGGGRGAETYCYSGGISPGYKLAKLVQSNLISETELFDRGVKINPALYVLKHTNMPSVLVETAFIDNLDDAKVLGSQEGRQRIATGIAKGILTYLNMDFKGDDNMDLKNELKNITETVKILATDVANLKNPVLYNYIDENLPSWAYDTVKKLCDKGYLKGDGSGLALTDDLLRILVINDRAGIYDMHK